MDNYIVYKALDYLYTLPEKPMYVDILNDEGNYIGCRLVNPITISKKDGFILATRHPYFEHRLLAFGLYPVRKFLLKPVGVIKNIMPK